MTSIVLTQPHTHAGRAHKAGERLDVDGSTADWLIANGIARHDRRPVPVLRHCAQDRFPSSSPARWVEPRP